MTVVILITKDAVASRYLSTLLHPKAAQGIWNGVPT